MGHKPHFDPSYNPWQQRLCLCPDNDFYDCLKTGKAKIATGHIERFTEDSIVLKNGDKIGPLDVIITATGLTLLPLGGIKVIVDGQVMDPSKTMLYKGFAPEGIPNCAMILGYLNSSWTLRVDLVAGYVVKLIRHMKGGGFERCVPRRDGKEELVPLLNFNSGYINRGRELGRVPMQGKKSPWKLHQNYFYDVWELRYKKVNDGVMTFFKGEDKEEKKAK